MPLLLPAPPDGHDRGIAHDPTGFAKVFDLYPDHRFIGLDEYIGYQHADIQTPPAQEAVKLAVELRSALLSRIDRQRFHVGSSSFRLAAGETAHAGDIA